MLYIVLFSQAAAFGPASTSGGSGAGAVVGDVTDVALLEGQGQPEAGAQEDCVTPFYKKPKFWAFAGGCLVTAKVWGLLTYSGATAYALTAIGLAATTPAVLLASTIVAIAVGAGIALGGLALYNYWSKHGNNNAQQPGAAATGAPSNTNGGPSAAGVALGVLASTDALNGGTSAADAAPGALATTGMAEPGSAKLGIEVDEGVVLSTTGPRSPSVGRHEPLLLDV